MWALRLPETEMEMLRECAESAGTSMTEVIVHLIRHMEEIPARSPKKPWALRLPETEKEILRKRAKSAGTTMTEVIVHLIRQYHEEHVENQKKKK